MKFRIHLNLMRIVRIPEQHRFIPAKLVLFNYLIKVFPHNSNWNPSLSKLERRTPVTFFEMIYQFKLVEKDKRVISVLQICTLQ